ncbi:hypothetical protein ACFPME_01970 [Rhodanobacter umsongensis]|uniref:Uncharacterized protein n=1 Tax=Rhodanobacter umsongensis TaxID=633153 RepID=A0ABW0JIP6_9GAMM
MPGTHLTLPLFAEGLATYVSTVVSPGYTDGQYLLQDDLGALPDSGMRATAKRFLADSDGMTIDPVRHRTSMAFRRWFQAGRTPFQAGLPNRAGYWLGLHVIRVLRRSRSLHEIAAWSPLAGAGGNTRRVAPDCQRPRGRVVESWIALASSESGGRAHFITGNAR